MREMSTICFNHDRSISRSDTPPPCPPSSQILSNVTADNSTYAVGYVHLTLTQGGFSLTELTDIDPVDLLTLLGNIGGFWGKRVVRFSAHLPTANQISSQFDCNWLLDVQSSLV